MKVSSVGPARASATLQGSAPLGKQEPQLQNPTGTTLAQFGYILAQAGGNPGINQNWILLH
jgi:hypothetical protein